MSVVEKEALVVEREENDLGATRKSVAKNGAAGPAGKINHLPAFRGRVSQPKIDSKRYLGDRSRELASFVSPLDERIRRCFKYRASKYRRSARAQAKVAELVLEVVRQLTFRETGVFNLEAPVSQLLSSLFAGAVEVGIITGLARRAHKALIVRDKQERDAAIEQSPAAQSSRGLGYDVSRELDELVMLLKWYVRRKMSLYAVEVASIDGYSGGEEYDTPAGHERDMLFSLDVMHDHQVFGVKGCLLTSGVCLLGRDGEALWLRVSLLSNGKPVMARPEWSSWTDPGGGAPVELLPESTPFCSLVPIRPNSQRLVIDEIRAFVPYCALQLPAGRSDVEVVVAVIDSEGQEVLRESRQESICVSHGQLGVAPVPAPHSLGMWPHDVVSGDKISELAVTSGFKVVAGWERHSISVSFDLSLFMHAGESVMLECRFVNARGDIVELSSLGMPFVASELNVAVESVSSYRYRRVLHPKGAWALYQGLCIDIPVEFLLLSPGSHEITCELVIVSSDDQVLCGDMSRVVVHVPNRVAQRDGADQASAESRHVALSTNRWGGASVELESFDIEPTWRCGDEDCVRVTARFISSNQAQQLADLAAGRVGEIFSPFRVEVSLERQDGHVLLQAYSDGLGMSFKPVTRAVCVDPYSGTGEHSVVTNFKREEVLGWSLGGDGVRVGAKSRLFARVTALSLSGDVLASETKEFFVKPPVDGGRKVVHVEEPAPVLVDAVASANAQGERLTARVLVNLPAGERAEEGVRVQFVVCGPNGSRFTIATKDLHPQQRGVWTREIAGLCQYGVECEHRLSNFDDGAGYVLEASLLSRGDEVLQSVRQPVQVAGVLSEVDDTAADFDSDLAADAGSAGSFGIGADASEVASSRGLWARVVKRFAGS